MSFKKLPLEDGETVELRSPGALNLSQPGRWRLGEWIKTNNRVLFLQGENLSFAAALDLLTGVEQCERDYSFGKKPCLKISWRKPQGESSFWLISPDINAWQGMFAIGQCKGVVAEKDIAILAKELGSQSEGLLWFMYRKRHATISDLATKIGIENHMIVLEKIRGEINPAAEKIIGGPILTFRQSWTDPLLGQNAKKIKYSWWLADGGAKDEPFYDIIDEGEYCRVVVESPETAQIVLDGHILKVIAGESLSLSITLPDFDFIPDIKKFYRNGVLELQLMKADRACLE